MVFVRKAWPPDDDTSGVPADRDIGKRFVPSVRVHFEFALNAMSVKRSSTT